MLRITNPTLFCSLQFLAFFKKLKLKFTSTAKRNKSELNNLFSHRVLVLERYNRVSVYPSIAQIPSLILRVSVTILLNYPIF